MPAPSAGANEAERGDTINIEVGDGIRFEHNCKGFRRGQRIEVADKISVPINHAKSYQIYQQREVELAVGDRIRISHNGYTADGAHRLNNGSLYTVGKFTESGDIVLRENGWIVSKDYGHLNYGYVVTVETKSAVSMEESKWKEFSFYCLCF